MDPCRDVDGPVCRGAPLDDSIPGGGASYAVVDGECGVVLNP